MPLLFNNVPFRCHVISPTAIDNILYFSDKAPEGLVNVLQDAFPRTNKVCNLVTSVSAQFPSHILSRCADISCCLVDSLHYWSSGYAFLQRIDFIAWSYWYRIQLLLSFTSAGG